MEWQYVGDNQWDFGIKIRGAVREKAADVFFDEAYSGPDGGWVWIVYTPNLTRGRAAKRHWAMAEAEKVLGIV
jgi:hypothetical protein